MTRKRYIKLLMAGGMKRNVSNGLAQYACEVIACSYHDAAVSSERVYRRMARSAKSPLWRVRWEVAADILHRALYGEVAHE